MKTKWLNVLAYTGLITRKWVPLVIAALDIIVFATQLLLPSFPFRLPQWAFLLILVICLYWAGYQVYFDLASRLPSFPTEPPPYEILSYSFDIYFGDIPRITFSLYVVNCQPRELVLESLEVTQFHLSGGGPYLDPIPHTEDTRIGARCSKLVTCKRQLTDGEAKAITKHKRKSSLVQTSASLYVHWRAANICRKKYHYHQRDGSTTYQVHPRSIIPMA